MYPAASTIRSRHEPRLLTFRKLHPKSDHSDIKVRRRSATPKLNNASPPKLDQAMLIKTPGAKPDAQVSHEILGKPSEEMTREAAKMASIQLAGEW